MALGATLKVKMDTSDVGRGLSGMKSKVSRAFGAIKRVGMVAFGAIAAAATGLAAAAVSATNFVRSVEQMAIQTGLSVKEVLDLQHAFKLVNVDAGQAADVMSEFQKRLAEADLGQGEAKMGLDALGLSIKEMKDLSTIEAFERALRAAAEMTDQNMAMMAMDKLFGSKGFEILRLARQFDSIMDAARKGTTGLASLFGDTSKFSSFEQSMARASLFAREIQMRLVKALPLEKIGEVLDRADLDGLGEKMTEELDEFFKAPESKLVEWGIFIGRTIGEGIVVGMVEYLTSADGLKMVAGMITGGAMRRYLKGEAESEKRDALKRTPAEEREYRSKARFNWPLWQKAIKGRLEWNSRKSSQPGPEARLSRDLLLETKESNRLLRRITPPAFA
jgi:hypothetical protein